MKPPAMFRLSAVLAAGLACLVMAGAAVAQAPPEQPGEPGPAPQPQPQPQPPPQPAAGPGSGPAAQLPAALIARRMAEVAILQQMLPMRLGAAELEAALPPLRALRDAQKVIETTTLQMLDAQKRSLLAAQPGQVPQPVDDTPMQAANRRYAQQMPATAEALARALGPDRGQFLLMLASGPPMGQPQMPGGGPGGQPWQGGPAGPGGQPGFQPQFGPQGGMPMGGQMGQQPRLSLAEFVDLLEQKLAAIKK